MAFIGRKVRVAMTVREIIAETIRRNDWVLGSSIAERHSAVLGMDWSNVTDLESRRRLV